MSRLVIHDAQSLRKLDKDDIDPEKGDVAVCQCGLSGSYPFCDGTHRQTREEDDDTLYRYHRGEDGLERRRVKRIVYTDGESETFEPVAE